ncbi:flagellar hook-basal body complex protein FliE [Paenibacillus assamensis]|uniref:flagellar hook-basal body complex protein FliE n=1 Tax=Paenibacillus assamensis TaxID=311244 RepID=UPI0003FEAE4A|nr:flagellar hook-basal body complex protein FliE [Paenibacillus assamensis]
MIHNSISPVQTGSISGMSNVIKPTSPAEVTESFNSFLTDAIANLEQQEKQVHNVNDKFLIGEASVDQVMITSERALLNLQLTTQVRNKVIEAYQEIMRIQL